MTQAQPSPRFRLRPLAPLALLAPFLVAACGGPASDAPQATGATQAPAEAAPTQTLTLGAYTTPREAYAEIVPAFRKQLGSEVKVNESYLGSGAQARAIVAGFEADVAALSLEPDIANIQKAGLITSNWKSGPNAGVVTKSIVVFGVRPGNPKGIKDWDDLAKAGVDVLTPNVRTSGGARWNIAAIYGAALRGHTSAKAGDAQAAGKLLGAILKNVKNMDAGARESLLNFERGVGDVIITYENEILVGQSKGQKYELVVPKSTILIENPVAIVDKYADAHGTRALAEKLVAYLYTPEAQRIYAKQGLRPVDATVAAEVAAKYPAPADLFTIRDLGDWAGVQKAIFDAGASYDQALALAQTGDK